MSIEIHIETDMEYLVRKHKQDYKHLTWNEFITKEKLEEVSGVCKKEKRNLLYGYRTYEQRKFFVDVEDVCGCINGDWGFSDDYYVFTTEEERNNFIKNSDE